MQTDYARDVFRLAGFTPNLTPGKGKLNLNQQTTFTRDDVRLDDRGNIVDMPLLRRKPCFGRPERYFRGISEKAFKETWIGEELFIDEVPTGCQRCSVLKVCGEVCDSRVASDPVIAAKLEGCDGIAANLAHPFRNSVLLRQWIHFAHAIKEHGGWTNVNDARVAMDDYKREEERRKKRRKAAREKRQRDKIARGRRSKFIPVTAEFCRSLDAEMARRLQILINLRSYSMSPKWISKLKEVDCEFHVNVWAARELLKRQGENYTGTAIACDMEKRCTITGQLSSASLRNKVYRALERINKLEDDRSGNPIWDRFQWQPKPLEERLTPPLNSAT